MSNTLKGDARNHRKNVSVEDSYHTRSIPMTHKMWRQLKEVADARGCGRAQIVRELVDGLLESENKE